MANNLLRLSVLLEESYDSNSIRSASGSEVSDFITRVRPEISLLNDWKNVTMITAISSDYKVYAKNPEFNSTSNFFTTDLNAVIAKHTSMGMGAGLSYASDIFGIKDFSALNLQIENTNIITGDAYMNLIQSLTKRLSLTAASKYSALEFTDETLVDTRTFTGSALMSYNFKDDWALSSDYHYTRLSFPRTSIGDAEIHSLSLGLSGILTKSLTFNVSGGAAYVPGITGRYEWIASATIYKDLKNATFMAGFSRGLFSSAGLSTEINTVNLFKVGYEVPITEAFKVGTTATYAENHSQPTGLLDTKSYNATLSADWQVISWCVLGVDYRHFRAFAGDSSTAVDTKGDRVGVRVSCIPYEKRF